MKFELNAQKRTLQGSGASRRLRHANKVPAIVYGGTAAPLSIQLDHNQILLSLKKEAFHSSVLTLNIDGAMETVLLRDAQVHPTRHSSCTVTSSVSIRRMRFTRKCRCTSSTPISRRASSLPAVAFRTSWAKSK